MGDATFAVQRFASIGSTNTALLAEAAAGAPEGLVFLADHQTAGRGRLDRRWEAPPGASLLVSVLFRPTWLPPSALHLVTVAVALAARAACAAVAGVEPGLKWPNDLLVDDRKLAGILAEAVAERGRVAAVVVGMGLNVQWPEPLPGELAATATALNVAAGHPVDREAVLDGWLAALAPAYEALRDPAGRAATLAAYRAACVTLGRPVRAELPGGEALQGTAVDVTDEGHLVLDLGDGTCRTIAAGDVVHARID